MKTFQELLTKLQKLDIIQTSMDWGENIPNDIWDEYLSGKFKTLKSGMEVDTHRHYETSITAIGVCDRILGIRHITNIFSESSSCEDCFVKMEFFEMTEVQEITYKKV